MRRTFLSNLAFVLLLNLLIKPLYLFGVEVGVQNRLGAEEYGLYFALLNSAFLLQIINDFGIQIFNNRHVAIDKTRQQNLFPGLIALKVVLGLLYFIFLGILGYFLGYQSVLPLLLLIGINLVLTSLVLFLRSGVSGQGYYRIDSALSVLDKFLMFLIVGALLILVRKGSFSVYHFVVGQMAALVLTSIVAFYILRRLSPFNFSLISFKGLKGLAKAAMPYALAVFLMTLYTRLDGVMIMGLLSDGKYESGVYAAGYRILDALNMVAFLFAALLLPMFSNVQDLPEKLRVLLEEGFRYMLFLVVPVCVFAVFYRNSLMTFLYTQADAYWGTVFAILIVTFVMTGMMYVFGTLLTATGRVRKMNVLFAVTVFLNAVLNWFLIPRYKAAGAAVATAITQCVAICGILLLAFRVARVQFSISYGGRISAFCVLVLVAGYLDHKMVTSMPLVLAIYLLVVIGGALGLGVVRLSELRSMLRRS